jgi:hypothetical protein
VIAAAPVCTLIIRHDHAGAAAAAGRGRRGCRACRGRRGRRGCPSCRGCRGRFIVLDVEAPGFPGGETSILVRAIDPTQNSSGITSITSPTVMDSVTLVRRSQGFF